MIKINMFYGLCLNFLAFISWPCLSQAGLNEASDNSIEYIIGYLDQQSWARFLRVNKRFNELTLKEIKAIRVKGDSATDVIAKLTVLLLKVDPESIVNKTLQELDVSRSSITDDDLRDLIAFLQVHFPRLQSLDLNHNCIGAGGAQHLVGLIQLETLDLSGNRIGAGGAQHLEGLAQLKKLDLWNNNIGAEGARHLSGLTRLEVLKLYRNNIGAGGAQHLVGLIELQRLDLRQNNIGDDGIVHLAGLIQLKTLDLEGNSIGARGAQYLAGLTQLQTLNLNRNRIEIEGALQLVGLTQLKWLELYNNNIVDEGAVYVEDAFKQAIVGCKIIF